MNEELEQQSEAQRPPFSVAEPFKAPEADPAPTPAENNGN